MFFINDILHTTTSGLIILHLWIIPVRNAALLSSLNESTRTPVSWAASASSSSPEDSPRCRRPALRTSQRGSLKPFWPAPRLRGWTKMPVPPNPCAGPGTPGHNTEHGGTGTFWKQREEKTTKKNVKIHQKINIWIVKWRTVIKKVFKCIYITNIVIKFPVLTFPPCACLNSLS